MIKVFFYFFLIFLYMAIAKVELTTQEKAFFKENPKIVLGLDKNWSPYIIKKGSFLEGFEVDFINLINKKLGSNITLIVNEWENIVFLDTLKKIDGLSMYSFSTKTKSFFNFLKPYKYIFTYNNKKCKDTKFLIRLLYS